MNPSVCFLLPGEDNDSLQSICRIISQYEVIEKAQHRTMESPRSSYLRVVYIHISLGHILE